MSSSLTFLADGRGAYLHKVFSPTIANPGTVYTPSMYLAEYHVPRQT